MDDHSSVPFPVQQNKDDQTSYITASESNGTAANNRSQVTNGNAYEGFFDNQQGAQSQHHHQQQQQQIAGPSAASTTQGAFVPASQLSQVAPNPLAFLEAANRPAPDPSTLPFIDFGNSPAPLLVSGSLDNTIKVWNVEEGTCARTMFGHIEGVWAVDMDKLRIVSASHDRTIKVWDRNGGKCLHTLVGHRGAVTSIGLGDDKVSSFIKQEVGDLMLTHNIFRRSSLAPTTAQSESGLLLNELSTTPDEHPHLNTLSKGASISHAKEASTYFLSPSLRLHFKWFLPYAPTVSQSCSQLGGSLCLKQSTKQCGVASSETSFFLILPSCNGLHSACTILL